MIFSVNYQKKEKVESKKGAVISELKNQLSAPSSRSKRSDQKRIPYLYRFNEAGDSSMKALTTSVNSLQIQEPTSEIAKMVEAQQKLSKLLQHKPLHHQVLFQLMGVDEEILDPQKLPHVSKKGNVIHRSA